MSFVGYSQLRAKVLAAACMTVALGAGASPKVTKQELDPALAPKVSTDLLLASKAEKQGKRLSASLTRKLQRSQRDGLNQFIVVTKGKPESLDKQIVGLGYSIFATYEQPGGFTHTVVRGGSFSGITEIAKRDDVIYVLPEPIRINRTGSVNSQGDVSMRSQLARTNFGFNGSGIRVGVISDSVSRTAGVGGTISGGFLTGSIPQNSGDLPAQVRVINNGSAGDTDEGAGMLEIVHDVAPGSPLSFADAATYSGFASNITALRTDAGRPCKVIVDDIGYFAEPIYQAGFIETAANECLPNGVLYFSAFGNDGEDAHERAFNDSNTASDANFPPTGSDFHDFGAAYGLASDKFLTFQVPNGQGFDVAVKWDEPGNGSTAQGTGATGDLDVYILSSPNLPVVQANILGAGLDVQGSPSAPSGEPFEVAGYTNSTGAAQTVYIAVDHYTNRRPGRVHVQIFADAGVTFSDRSLISDFTAFGHPNGLNVVGTSAIFYGEVDSNGTLDAPTNQLNVEPFSSKGGVVPLLIGDTGVRLNTAINRIKPNLTAPDGANTLTFGDDITFDADSFPNFFGTSAAAPHAAAAAAVVWSANPNLAAGEVLNRLSKTVRDIETAGFDVKSGFGLIDTNAAVQSVVTPVQTGYEAVDNDFFLNSNGWGPLGQTGSLFTSAIGSRSFDAANTALNAVLATSSKGRVIGWLEDSANDLPYSSVGTGKHVRAKFHVTYSGGGDSGSDSLANRVPNFRLSLRSRGAVSTQLEINHNAQTGGSASQLPVTRELGPSKSVSQPSIYRVDFDPADVPHLTGSTTEGIQRGFETVVSGADYSFVSGTVGLTDSSIGTYPALSNGTAPVKTFAAGGTANNSDFDNTNIVTARLGYSTAEIFRYVAGPSSSDYFNPSILTVSINSEPNLSVTKSPDGITVNSSGLATSRLGVTDAAFNGGVFGDTNATRLRSEESKLYRFTFRLKHTGASNTSPYIRFNARTIGFGYNATYELLGARGLSGDGQTYLAQVLPGSGNQMPGTTADGSLYNLILNTPFSADIRADKTGTVAQRFPNMSAQPGPGSSATSLRDFNVGFTVADSLSLVSSTATDSAEVANDLQLNRIEVRQYDQITD